VAGFIKNKVGKSGHVNELVKNGAGGRGKSSSYSLETRRAEGKGLRVVMSDEIRGDRQAEGVKAVVRFHGLVKLGRTERVQRHDLNKSDRKQKGSR
jgi:hypothetical protein